MLLCTGADVCLSSFATFSCQTLRDGSAVLRIAPSIVCYESDEHKTMIAISLLALIVYVFGLPMITLGTTLYASKWDKLRDENFLATIGLFYREYGAWGCTCVGVSVARRQHSIPPPPRLPRLTRAEMRSHEDVNCHLTHSPSGSGGTYAGR